MYFPCKVFILLLQQLDTYLKKVVNPTTLNEHGDNLRLLLMYFYNCESTILYFRWHDEIKKQATHKSEFSSALLKQLPINTFDLESETAVNNVYEELTRKLCNIRIQEF